MPIFCDLGRCKTSELLADFLHLYTLRQKSLVILHFSAQFRAQMREVTATLVVRTYYSSVALFCRSSNKEINYANPVVNVRLCSLAT